MEKTARLTKAELAGVREIGMKEFGLRKLIEETSLVAGKIEQDRNVLGEEIRKRLKIGNILLHFNLKAKTVTWSELETPNSK